MSLVLVTWNIKTGGSGGRLDAIVALLRRERPDLIALQELRGFTPRRMADFAGELGMVPHLARSGFGQAVGVLVRPTLRIARRAAVRWRLHHAAAAVTVTAAGGPVTLVSTHLNPFSGERRRREATWLAARFRSRRVLIAGDLNSLNPVDDHAASLAGLAGRFQARHLRPDGTIDTTAMTAFERAGFTDLWRVAGVGDGRSVPTTQGGGAEFGPMRLDYVLGTPDLAGLVREVRVLRGQETEYASDHYPLRAVLDL